MSQMKAGAILSYVSLFITVIITLLYTPIVIRLLGQAEYGLYMLIGSIAAYFSVMDFGLGNAIVRFTARNRVLGDKEKESKLNGVFLVFYSIIGLATIAGGTILYYKIESIFGSSLSDIEIKKAQLMVIILIVNFALSFPLSVFSSIIQAYEKFVIVKLVTIARNLLTPLFTLPVIFLGFGSVSMVIISTVVNISSLLYTLFYGWKYMEIKFYFGKIDKILVWEIVTYSFFIFLNIIVDQIYWNTNQIILGIVSGTIPVAIFAIAIQFIKLYMQFSTSISGLFLPKISMMVAKKASNKELSEVMNKFGRLQFIAIAFILSGFILFGKEFLIIWAGTSYSSAYHIILLIMIPLTVPLIQNIGVSILYAKNLQGFRIIVLFSIAIINILLTIPLAKEYAGVGAATATAASLIIGHIFIMNIYYYFKIKLDMINFWKNILSLTIPVTISVLIGFIYKNLFENSGILAFTLEVLIFTLIYVYLMFSIGFNSYEKKLLTQLLNYFTKYIKKVKTS